MEPSQIVKRIDAMRLRARARDERQRIILAMRLNKVEDVAPGLLPEDFKQPLVANLIDTAAHDLSEVMAPLPSISCGSSSQTTQTKKDFANKRALIANSYIQNSRLAQQMYDGADRYASYGYMAYMVEPDFKEKRPDIRIDDGASYWTCDNLDRVRQYVTVMSITTSDLCFQFPDHADIIRNIKGWDSKTGSSTDTDLEVAVWVDDDCTQVIILKNGHVLATTQNVLDRCPVRLVRRPNLQRGEVKGQFDDVVWVQVARALNAAYTMSAVQQSVEAPILVPDGTQELEFGPYAVMQSNAPEKIGRLALNVPQGLFPEQQNLAQEQRVGSRYPEGRSGNIDASIITGQGVQALMGTFDTQIQTFHRLNEPALEDVLGMCFEMDQKLWPNEPRSVRVRDAGSPVEITYSPAKDIKNDYSVDVSYGAVAGLDPNRSLIFLLQAVSGGFLSRETGRKHMPIDVDQVAETRRMNTEAIRDSLLQSVAATAQAIPQMAAAGQDPREIVEQMAQIIKYIDQGKTMEEAVALVFAPKIKPEDQAAPPPEQSAMDALAAAQQGGAPAQPGAAQIEGPQSPGQDLLMGLAGLTPGGAANLQSNVSTRAVAR